MSCEICWIITLTVINMNLVVNWYLDSNALLIGLSNICALNCFRIFAENWFTLYAFWLSGSTSYGQQANWSTQCLVILDSLEMKSLSSNLVVVSHAGSLFDKMIVSQASSLFDKMWQCDNSGLVNTWMINVCLYDWCILWAVMYVNAVMIWH